MKKENLFLIFAFLYLAIVPFLVLNHVANSVRNQAIASDNQELVSIIDQDKQTGGD